VAIGLAHTNPARAAQELRSLVHGQWGNGMMPHMIYSPRLPYNLESWLWGTGGLSPSTAKTSGLTQPPMLAIAVERVARALPDRESLEFVQTMLPTIVRFHQWIYRERDPKDTGLAGVIHSWESGLDDTPYWTEAMQDVPRIPWRWRWLKEYRPVRPEERATPTDLQQMLSLAYFIKHYHYNSAKILAHSSVVLQDLVFNSIFAAANESLERLAETAGVDLPPNLTEHFAPTRRAMEELWDAEAGEYFTRDAHTGKLLRIPTIAGFMPLFAGTASPGRARHLRDLLRESGSGFHTEYPLPSVPTDSRFFEPKRYWRGPVWVNMNWFVIQGLRRYGFMAEAAQLRDKTLKLVGQSGFREYYDPLDGDGLGAERFSWSAALTLDLLAQSEQ
jgi:hypothetical protein